MKIPLILELARFSVKVNCIKLTHDCILELKKAGITEQGKLIEVECLECEYEIQKFGPKIVTYTKGVVEAQLKLIKNLDLTLQHAVQLGDPYVIQVVCTTQWNLCLPLLQQNLHQHVRKPLIAVADVLEEIDSMLIFLRCQVHMEIARIEEDEDRIEIAVQHLQKAIHLDNSGQYQEHLRLNFNRLSLYAMLYKSPERLEDQALMMIEQAKRGKEKNNVRQKRSLLVNAGLALAPDLFQVVLDSENEAKVSSGYSQSQVSYLCAKAQHHVKSVDKVDGHLKHLKKENDKERIRLWANLAKVARTQEVWDVCRTACRFCLLYDDTLFRRATKPKKTQKKKASITMMDDDQDDGLPGELLLPAKSFSFERDLLRILAEIRFINAEATIHLLRLQGLELNDHTVPTEDKSQHPSEYVLDFPESDLEWKAYRSTVTLLMLCNAVARGLILCWIPKPKRTEEKKLCASPDKSRKASAKGHEKANAIPSLSVDPSGLPDIKAALEICEFALNVTSGTIPNEIVPVAVKQQIIATWVKAKQLNQQQIGHKLWTEEESSDEAQNPIARILVGLEMYSCTGLGLMDFTVPALSQLVKLALECSWSDSLVELQTLTRLTYFAYVLHDYEIVMTCSQRILQSVNNFFHNSGTKKYEIPDNTARQEMLSTAACIQGKSIMENLAGQKHLRIAASKAFAQSASLIFKHLATVKARLGCNFMMEIQKFAGESEDYVSRIWRHMVTVSRSIVEQLNCFKNAINALQVSLSASGHIIGALSKSSQFTAPQDAQPTIARKKEDKKEEKQVEESFVKEQPKRKESVDTLPINVEEWAHYDCPNEVRNTFKQKTNSYGINWNNFTKPGSYNKLIQIEEDFLNYGHKNCSAEILLERANIHRMIAKQEGNEEEKYSHCLDAYNLAQMAVSKAEEVFHNVCSLIAVNEKELRLAQKYLSQCSEALLQCMGIAFSYNITNVLGPASLEMVECFGQFDPVSTSQFLALHQSCSASMMMKHILLTANSDTSSSQLAALLHLQNQLKQNRNTSDLLKNVEQQLTATSMAWRNLCIPVEHFNIVNELPSNFYIIILQHSEDRSNLYSSLIEKPKVSTAQQKGKSTQPMVQAKVSRFPVNPNTFCTLLEKVYLYKQQNMKKKIDKNGHNLITDFSEILEIMEEYLKPLLSQFDFPNIREHSTSASAAESGKIKVKDKDTKHTRMQGTPMELGLCVVLLADKSFMELPLETLSVFQEEGICSVSRDFSLQILYNRLQVDESESEIKDVQRSKEPKPKAEQKKNVKMAPVHRVLPSNCMPVDTRNLKYIVDPYNEGREPEALSPSQKMKEILEKYHDLFTLQWEGVIGNVYVPSQAEWEQLLTNCSAFLFYGMERFLSHILLNRLVAMNIPSEITKLKNTF
ncbi:TPR repeat-containing protein C10orf93 [Anas platyrhynchos]|uniref:TPR repeat-containing protein C10orf93 n=1 Tax=Anas platyrhynchos TaxID=8839 RepID=R0LLK2_ANAPL|nr:TPR repeat-containing protein C10orf93 [Anas platyrhynchos]